MSATIYTGTNETHLMKVLYGKAQDKQFYQDNELLGTIKQIKDFVGKQKEAPVELSIGGGVSAGSLGDAGFNKQRTVTITAKKLYGTILLDNETVQASKSDLGAFVRMSKKDVARITKSFFRNLERMLVRGDATGTGALITGHASNSVVTVSSGVYTVSFDAASQYFASDASPFEEGDAVNINSETTALIVNSVTTTETSVVLELEGTSSRLATLAGGCGAAFGASDKIYMQKSKDKEFIGIRGAISATSSTLYGVDVGRRWQAYQLDASDAEISTDLINKVILNMILKCGEAPKMIMVGLTQYIKLLNALEDKKSYDSMRARYDATISYKNILVTSPKGDIPVVINRFMKEDEAFFLNTNHIELHLRPEGFAWLPQDLEGSQVFARDNANRNDAYMADFGGYGQCVINPNFQGYLHNLAI